MYPSKATLKLRYADSYCGRFGTLPDEERKLWHSHVYEVKSGMLVMPQPGTSITPSAAWEAAETSEMEQVIELYGKTYHFWQVDRGDVVPMGHPELMLSFTEDSKVSAEAKSKWEARDRNFKVNSEQKAKNREGIPVPETHPGKNSNNSRRGSGARHDLVERSGFIATRTSDIDLTQMPIMLGRSVDGKCRVKVQSRNFRRDCNRRLMEDAGGRPRVDRSISSRIVQVML